VAGIVLAAVAYWAVRVHVTAVVSCIESLDGGGGYFFFVLVLPTLTLVLWALAGLTYLLARRVGARFALLAAAAVVTVAALWFLAGTPGYIRSLADGYGEVRINCPSGAPKSWPSWLDR
jgi:hypothetical protein